MWTQRESWGALLLVSPGPEPAVLPDRAEWRRSRDSQDRHLLKTSHTHLYTHSDWECYDLLDIFKEFFAQEIKQLFPNGKVTYPSIGIFTRKLHGKTFVKAVLDGSPASKAGVLAGDEIRSVDGDEYDAVRSFAAKRTVIARIQRKPDPGSVKQITVVPEQQTPGERYLDAMRASARVIRNSDCSVGYIHVWSFAGEHYYLGLLAQIQNGNLKDADALILDLRDGWGGANPYYLSPFDLQKTAFGEVTCQEIEYCQNEDFSRDLVALQGFEPWFDG